MDILSREKSILEVKMCESLTLLPNSISIVPDETSGLDFGSTSWMSIDIQYATSVFNIVVKMDNVLDFMINSPRLLPMIYLDEKPFPLKYENCTLMELLNWLIGHIKSYVLEQVSLRDNLKYLYHGIKSLRDMNVIEDKSFEIEMLNGEVILFVKFTVDFIYLNDLTSLVKENMLINTGGHYFVLKLVFNADTGKMKPDEHSITYSTEISRMLPVVKNHSFLTSTDLEFEEFIIDMKEEVSSILRKSLDSWESRSKFLLLIFHLAEELNIAVSFIDITQMKEIRVAFQTDASKIMLKVELSDSFPTDEAKCQLFYQSKQAEEVRETRHSSSIKEQSFNFNCSSKSEAEIADYFLDVVRKISQNL